MKNFIWWRVPLYLILGLEVVFLWWVFSSLMGAYKEILSLTSISQTYSHYESKVEKSRVNKPTPKATITTVPKPKPAPKPKPKLKLKPAPVPYVVPKPTNPGPLPPNGPKLSPGPNIGPLPPN